MHIVHTEASNAWGGQEIRILTEALGMQARGHRVSILCAPTATIYREAQARGLPVYAMPFERKGLRGIAAVHRFLKANHVDVINTHSSIDSWLVALANRLRRARVAVVRTRHISAPISNSLSSRWLYQRGADHIVTTGEKLRAQLIRDNGYRAETITSVPTGIDTARYFPGDRQEARRALGLPPEGKIVGIVATLRSWKGHRHLVEAFAQLPDPGVRLLMVGDGPQQAALRQQIAQLNLESRVTMPGNQSDVAPWLRALDVFALPSYANEGVPQALMQAMLTALPIVTTPVGSILEIIHDGETGVIVPPENPPALATAIGRLLTDTITAQRLGQQARAYALQHCGMESMLERMERIFEDVIRTQRR